MATLDYGLGRENTPGRTLWILFFFLGFLALCSFPVFTSGIGSAAGSGIETVYFFYFFLACGAATDGRIGDHCCTRHAQQNSAREGEILKHAEPFASTGSLGTENLQICKGVRNMLDSRSI